MSESHRFKTSSPFLKGQAFSATHDLDWRLLYCDDEYAEAVGLADKNDLLGYGWTQFCDPKILENIAAAEQQRGGGLKRPMCKEAIHHSKNGKSILVRSILSPIFDADGNVTSYHCAHFVADDSSMVLNKSLLNQTHLKDSMQVSDHEQCILVDGRIVFANDAFSRLLHYQSPEELYQFKDISYILNADCKGTPHQFFDEFVCPVDAAHNPIISVCRQSGDTIWVQVQVSPVQWGGQKALHLAITPMSDVIHSDVRLNRAFEAAKLGVMEFDVKTGKMVVDSHIEEILGYPAEYFTDFTKFIDLMDKDSVNTELKKLFEEKADEIDNENRIRHKDGHYIWLRCKGKMYRNKRGRGVKFLTVFWETTSDHETKEQLASVQQRYARSVQASGVGIWEYDAIERKMWWSKEMFLVHGFDEQKFEEVYGSQPGDLFEYDPSKFYFNAEYPVDLVHPEDASKLDFDVFYAKADSAEATIRTMNADGTYHWHRVLSDAMRGDDGKIVRTVGVTIDISEEKQIQQELIEAKECAEAGEKAKTEFLAKMSHEIRTPLNSVIGMNRLLEDTLLSDEQRGFARIARNSGEYLLSLINDILDFSKLNADKMTLDKVPFSLIDLLSESVEILEEQAVEKDLSLTSFVEDEISRLTYWGDKARLKQILLNFGSNAVKFTQQGGVNLRVRELPRYGPGVSKPCHIRFEVEDSGIGIERDRLASLFQEFSQADTSITRDFGGTGLGLAISKQLVELMGGEFGVRSEPDVGSVFWFDVPLEFMKEEALMPLSNYDVSAAPQTADSVSYTILVAEDNAANQMLVRTLLEKFGHRVEIANNGLEAVDMMSNREFDMVFMDLQMPEMDGLAATRIIRKLTGPVAQTPVVALTANANIEDKKQCLDAGMNDFLPKPIDFDAIEPLVQKWGQFKGRIDPQPLQSVV